MRGRKPKPTAIQIAEGDPGKYGIHKLEQKLNEQPKAAPGLPPCPKHLTGRARVAWKFWSTELATMRIDKRPDGPMLEGACRAYERAVTADLILDKSGLIVEDKYIDEHTGEARVLRVRKHPAVEVSNRAWMIVRAFCSEFGLSPASRCRIKVDAGSDSEPDDLTAVLSAPRVAESPHVQ